MRRALLLVTLLAACGARREFDIPADADIDMQATDFGCILSWQQVRAFRLTNALGYLPQSLAIADAPDGGVYPVGTVLQVIPNEAMVKRRIGFNPQTRDWEFFVLDPMSDGGTSILQRGGVEVAGHDGGQTCFSCHSQAEPQWDMTCETNHGCAPLTLTPAAVQALQNADPRCHE